MDDQPLDELWDVFISYASEDRREVAEPLARFLQGLGVSVWFDQTELKLGDSLRRKIDEGLARSRFGIVILSPSFFGKHYPNRELDGLAQREVDGRKVILPVWSEVDADDVRRFSPPLADRVAARWSKGLADVVIRIVEVISPEILQTALEKAPRVEPLPRLSKGSEIFAISHGAHLFERFNEDPGTSHELDLVSGFLQEVHDWGDLDIDLGEQVRAEYRINELLKELEAEEWFVYGKRELRRLKIGEVTDTWSVAILALFRGVNKMVFLVDGKIAVTEGGTKSGRACHSAST